MFLLLLAFSLSSCATNGMLVPQKPVSVNNYVLGKELEVTVGSPAVEILRAYEIPAFEVIAEFTPPKALGLPDGAFAKGAIIPARMIQDGGRYFIGIADWPNGVGLQIASSGIVEAAKNDGWRIYRDTVEAYGTVQKVSPYTIKHMGVLTTWPKDPFLKMSSVPYLSKEKGFKAELLYTGITGNSLRLTFREYSNDMARPAFTQELTYNLKESAVIAFRTLKIKVIKATNSSLKFTVIEDGGLPWLPK